MEVTDYQTFTTKDMPLKERRDIGVGDIWANQAKCKKCGDVIRSKNRHNMVYCSCGLVFVDGGSWYGRMGAKDLNDIEDMTEMYDDTPKEENIAENQ